MYTRWFVNSSFTSNRKLHLFNKFFLTNKLWKKEQSLHTSSSDPLVIRSPYADIKVPNIKYTDLIWNRCDHWQNYKAVTCGVTGENYTYSELKELSSLTGQSLINEGLNHGDVIALLLPNSPKYLSIILGASEKGLTVCSINTLFTVDEITYQLKNCGAKSIITFPEKVEDVKKSIENLKLTNSLPRNFKLFCSKVLENSKNIVPKNSIDLNDLVNKAKMINPDINSANHADNSLAFISHSSGTTGLPKGVCLTHKNFNAAILQTSQPSMTQFKKTNADHQDVISMLLPISHNFGLVMSLVSLYNGLEVVTLPSMKESTFLTMLNQHKVSFLPCVTPMVLFLGTNPLVTEQHLRNLRTLFIAAAPVGKDDFLKFSKKAPRDLNIVQGYGLTEGTCFLTYLPYGVKNIKSIGVPVMNTEIKVIDLETGKLKGPNKNGEIYFKGPQTTVGYLNNLKATQEVLNDEGWFRTGDVGYYDEDGYFYVVDRLKDMIKVKGYQVAPAELEHILRSFPGVEEAAVIGVPHPRNGESPIAFIETKSKSSVTEKSLNEFFINKVAPYKKIEKYIFVDSIPRSNSGKILRKDLRLKYLN